MKNTVLQFTLTAFFIFFSPSASYANPIVYPPYGYITDASEVVVYFIQTCLVFYFVTAYLESIAYNIIFDGTVFSRLELIKTVFKINLMTYPATQLIVLVYYAIVKANENIYLEPYYFDSINANFRWQYPYELAVSIFAIFLIFVTGLLLYNELKNALKWNRLEKYLAVTMVTVSSFVFADILLYLTVDKIAGINFFNYLSNSIQASICGFKTMSLLIRKYHFHFFRHYMYFLIEIIVTITEFFLLKKYLSDLKKPVIEDKKILICVVLANFFSLAGGEILLILLPL